MIEFVDLLWRLLGTIVAIVLLGVFAGFSPTLYIAQVSTAAQIKSRRFYAVSIMVGVLLGIVVLSILFQFFQLDTLVGIIDSTINALFVNVLFNLIIGVSFIAAGIWYIRKKPRVKKAPNLTHKAGYWALISLGFIRTFTSLSGATATFITSGLISNVGPGILGRLVLTILFLAATIAPFVLIMIAVNKKPERIETIIAFLKRHANSTYFRSTLGVIAIIFGAGIMLLNILLSITYR